MSKRDVVDWCVSRLVDNYEWQGVIEFDEWLKIQAVMRDAILSNNKLADEFIDVCEEFGVIESEG